MLHVNNWFTDDPFDASSQCYKSIKMVRGLHRQVGDKMNSAAGLKENEADTLWLNQYGMSHAQFSFVGFMAVFPIQVSLIN